MSVAMSRGLDMAAVSFACYWQMDHSMISTKCHWHRVHRSQSVIGDATFVDVTPNWATYWWKS